MKTIKKIEQNVMIMLAAQFHIRRRKNEIILM